MAKSVSGSTTTLALLYVFFILFASFELIPMAEAGQCEERAQKWTGPCIISSSCQNSCITREGAADGACHFDFPRFACFCYYNC